ncbi:MAG: hypothetical protein ACYCTB_11280 [bacterium]
MNKEKLSCQKKLKKNKILWLGSRGIGTIYELGFAKAKQIPVIAFIDNKQLINHSFIRNSVRLTHDLNSLLIETESMLDAIRISFSK